MLKPYLQQVATIFTRSAEVRYGRLVSCSVMVVFESCRGWFVDEPPTHMSPGLIKLSLQFAWEGVVR